MYTYIYMYIYVYICIYINTLSWLPKLSGSLPAACRQNLQSSVLQAFSLQLSTSFLEPHPSNLPAGFDTPACQHDAQNVT